MFKCWYSGKEDPCNAGPPNRDKIHISYSWSSLQFTGIYATIRGFGCFGYDSKELAHQCVWWLHIQRDWYWRGFCWKDCPPWCTWNRARGGKLLCRWCGVEHHNVICGHSLLDSYFILRLTESPHLNSLFVAIRRFSGHFNFESVKNISELYKLCRAYAMPDWG